MTLTPAYGRDYKNQRDALAAFEGGADFVIADVHPPENMGRYVSVRDLRGTTQPVFIRYGQLRKMAVVPKSLLRKETT